MGFADLVPETQRVRPSVAWRRRAGMWAVQHLLCVDLKSHEKEK